MPTIENVWSNAGSPTTGLNTFPISVGAITEGNLLVAPVTSDTGSLPDIHPFDDVLFADYNAAFSSFSTCYKIATGSEPGSYSWYDATIPAMRWAGSVIEISGTNGTIESYANNEAYGNLPISLSVTPTVNGSMIITVISLDNDIATTTMNAAFTQIAEADTGSLGIIGAKQLVGYYIQETAGPTGNFSHGTLSVTGAWQTSMIVIPPTAGADYPIGGAGGSYSWSGGSLGGDFTNTVVVSSGEYEYIGGLATIYADSPLAHNYTINAFKGEYSWSGNAATFNVNLTIATSIDAAEGEYAFFGSPAILVDSAINVMSVTGGEYPYAGGQTQLSNIDVSTPTPSELIGGGLFFRNRNRLRRKH